MTLTITTEQRDKLFAEVSADLPMLPKLSKTVALHQFAREEIDPVVRRAVDAYADHLQALAEIAPPEIADEFGALFDSAALADSSFLDDAVNAIAVWLYHNSAL